MANFVVKMILPIETSKPAVKWKLWTDGACGAKGSSIEIIMQSQTEIKLRYTAILAFNATNNVAEYEIEIIALRIIVEIVMQKFIIFSDSQETIQSSRPKFH